MGIVLNSVVARSVLDGVLLGEDCGEWYGTSHVIFSMKYDMRVMGIMWHTSPLAVDIVQRTLLVEELQAFYRTINTLRSSLACRPKGEKPLSFAPPHPAWAKMLRHVAAVYWFFLNMMPF